MRVHFPSVKVTFSHKNLIFSQLNQANRLFITLTDSGELKKPSLDHTLFACRGPCLWWKISIFARPHPSGTITFTQIWK